MGKTSATQVLQRPAFETRTRPIDCAGSDLDPGRATRSLEAEPDRDQSLSDDAPRPASVRVPPSLATHDTGAWGSGWACVEVDLIDMALRAERAAAAYLEARAAGMTAGRRSTRWTSPMPSSAEQRVGSSRPDAGSRNGGFGCDFAACSP